MMEVVKTSVIDKKLAKNQYRHWFKLTKWNIGLLIAGITFLAAAIYMQYSTKYEIQWNISESLPATFFILNKNELPAKNDYTAFNYYDKSCNSYRIGLIKKGCRVTFIKKATGVAGDVVTNSGREVFVNGVSMGKAKEYTLKLHRPLEVNSFTGVIPQGYYYVHSDHKDSFDSRYEEIGLIPVSEVRGKAYAYF